MKWYYWLRLWIWWNYIIKKDEFSYKLDPWYLWKIERYSDKILIYRRTIAHELYNGASIRYIDTDYIKKSKI